MKLILETWQWVAQVTCHIIFFLKSFQSVFISFLTIDPYFQSVDSLSPPVVSKTVRLYNPTEKRLLVQCIGEVRTVHYLHLLTIDIFDQVYLFMSFFHILFNHHFRLRDQRSRLRRIRKLMRSCATNCLPEGSRCPLDVWCWILSQQRRWWAILPWNAIFCCESLIKIVFYFDLQNIISLILLIISFFVLSFWSYCWEFTHDIW